MSSINREAVDHNHHMHKTRVKTDSATHALTAWLDKSVRTVQGASKHAHCLCFVLNSNNDAKHLNPQNCTHANHGPVV